MTIIRLTTRAAVVAAADTGDGGDAPRRRITGRLVAYDVIGHPWGPWDAVSFAPGSIDVPAVAAAVKLLQGHDESRALGVLASHTDSTEGLDGALTVSDTVAGREALVLAADGVLDGLSAGVRVIESAPVVIDGTTVQRVTRAELREVSLVPYPAYDTARVDSVAATERTPAMPDEPTTATVPAPVTADQVQEMIRAAAADLAPPAAAPLTPATPAPAVRAAETAPVVGRVVATDPEGYGRTAPAYITAAGQRITAGDYMSAYLMARDGQPERLAEIRAALVHETTTQVPGLLPEPIVGPLIGEAEGLRPTWGSGTVRVMPAAGKVFHRPTISTHVLVDPQATEKTEVASQALTIDLADVTKQTLAGALNVSRQAIDWSSPGLMDILMTDFMRIYAERTNRVATAALVAGATGTPIVWDATAGALQTALAQAAIGVWAVPGARPNAIWMAPDVWATLVGLNDTSDRPIFPVLAPTNAIGSANLGDVPGGLSIPGFSVVVDRDLAAGTLIMGDRRFFETYEDRRGFLRADEPSVLGQQIAYYGYVATYVADGDAFVPITITPAP